MKFQSLLLVPSESYVRDFDSRFAIAAVCASKGMTSIVGQRHEVNSIAKMCSGSFIYLDRALDAKNENWYNSLRANGGLIFNLDEEGGVYSESRFKEDILGRHRQNILDLCELDFLWGKKQETIIEEYRNIRPDQLKVIGNPRFDLIKKHYNYFPENGKKYILINTNFTAYNGFIDIREEYNTHITYLKLNPYLSNIDKLEEKKKDTYNWYKQLYHYQGKLFHSFCDLTDKLTKKGYMVVLRPHPGENPEIYKKRFKGNSLVKVDNKINHGYHLRNAIIVVHHDCTTAIEACIAKKKYISYQPILNKSFCTSLPLEISDSATNAEELIGYLHNGSINYDDKLALIKCVITNTDTDSIDTLTDLIINNGPRHGVDLILQPNTEIINYFKAIRRYSKSLIFNLINKNTPVNMRIYRGLLKFSLIKHKDLQLMLRYWEKKTRSEIQYKRIMPNSILLYQNHKSLKSWGHTTY